MTQSPPLYEPFLARFTGQLTSFVAKNGMRYSFHKPYPRIEKDRAYMMELNLAENKIRLIPVIG